MSDACGLLQDERGTTLTELLATVALLTVLVAALVPVLSIAGGSWDRTDRHTELLHTARRAMDKMVRDLRAAQSFSVVSPTLLRMTVPVGDGTGTTPTVEYRLNPATHDLEYRVAADFAYRRRITVTAGAAGIPAGYSVSVAFDHAALVTAGKSLAAGNDVRVRYWTGTQWVELDRFKDIPTAWNSTATRIWFKLQAPIPAGGSNNNYYLHYGDLSAGAPPADGDHVFLDYEDGSSLAGWTRRDSCAGTKSSSAADGFIFQASSGSCHRQFSKNVPHSDVEIFWGFWSSPSGASDGHQTGMSARRSDTGVGYVLTLADQVNATLRIRYWTVWSTTGGAIGSVPASVTPGTNYYGRFYLVGSELRAKYWAVGAAEPAWMLQVTHSSVASGAHYGQVNGYVAPMDHRHRHIIVRQRVDPEPTTTLGPEEAGARLDAFQALAGPLRAMSVQCFDAANNAIACPTAPGPSAALVRSVLLTLTVMDPTGEVADLVLTSRAYRQAP
jgi:type II secretory pathway pseudopilin PulG